MQHPDGKTSYTEYVERTKDDGDAIVSYQYAIGLQFEAFGTIEAEMLKFFGLASEHYLIDVGCGSGRLTSKIASYLTGAYLGTDVVPDLLAHASKTAGENPRFRFEVVDAIRIPERDGVADMVCFFSVFTHLLLEHTYLYLEEATRVLKSGGKIVFSFLEFRMESHWKSFEVMVSDARSGNLHPLNVFIDRDAIVGFARVLGLRIVQFRDGIHDFVPLPHPVTLDSGEVVAGAGRLGQSICVLEKP